MRRFAQTFPLSFRTYWDILTEVPGWPDAPSRRRFLRFIPFLIPLLLTISLLLWRLAFDAPRHERQLDAYSPLLGLEAEVQNLRANTAATPESIDASSLETLLHSPDEAQPLLESLRQKIEARAWKFTYTLGEPADPSPETPLLRSIPIRAKLTPTSKSPDSFQQLITVLPLFAQQTKRLDLMRLALRADDKGTLQADLQLRLTIIHAPNPPAP